MYAYIRSRGFSPEDAEDLTQGYFSQLLERNSLARADRQRGKFRFYLLGGLKNYLSDERDKATALKRGGGQKLSLLMPKRRRSASARVRRVSGVSAVSISARPLGFEQEAQSGE